MTQYFVDEHGCYLGGFDGAEPPEGAIEVPHPPEDARMVWDGEQFGPASTPNEPGLTDAIPMLNLHLVLIEDGHLETVDALMQAMAGPEGQRARAYWNKALRARRDNEWVNLLWPQLYATEADFDDAWARAAALNP